MKNIKNNKGITLIALSITIIIVVIIALIAIYSGKEIIKRAQIENLKTNMLLIEAKAKEYCEEASFKNGTSTDIKPESIEALKGTQVTTNNIGVQVNENELLYDVTNNLSEMGLKDIQVSGDEKYYVKYDIINVNVEVYNTKGIDGKYSLTEIEQIES